MSALQSQVFRVQQTDLLLLSIDFFLERVDLRSMCQSDLVPLFSGFGQIVIVLIFETFDSMVKFKLVFSLDREDLIFQFVNQSSVVILSVLVIFELLLIAFSQEVYLIIFLSQCSIEVIDLLHEGVFDELSESSHVCDPVLSLSD